MKSVTFGICAAAPRGGRGGSLVLPVIAGGLQAILVATSAEHNHKEQTKGGMCPLCCMLGVAYAFFAVAAWFSDSIASSTSAPTVFI
jgi:hypothetical protein